MLDHLSFLRTKVDTVIKSSLLIDSRLFLIPKYIVITCQHYLYYLLVVLTSALIIQHIWNTITASKQSETNVLHSFGHEETGLTQRLGN